ncbi:MAG: hypothetical protein RLZ98_3159 [Pseudomonadota bacterium]|jgi:pimeloyl-ACP methyl ester carboxylesterase
MTTSHDLPTRHTFVSQRQQMSYVDWGNPDAPPLVLVHGGRDHARSWDWVAERLRREWHVVALDLAGHGDSAWISNGHYTMPGHVYDLSELIVQKLEAPVTIIGHSMGGNVSLRYTGTYPETVARIVAIEGLGFSPKRMAERESKPMPTRLRSWIEEKRGVIGYPAVDYETFEGALARMTEAHPQLTPEQAHHLVTHGLRQKENGKFNWKFDPLLRAWPPYDLRLEDVAQLWRAITCPVLLVRGDKSWHTDPVEDGRTAHFADVRSICIEGASHWVHHDRLDEFMTVVAGFLSETT